MTETGDLSRQFQDPRIHAGWQAVYRQHPLQSAFNDRIMDRVVRWLRPAPGRRVLDAGCGSAEHTFRLARRGFSCVGVDVSAALIDANRRRAAELGLAERTQFLCRGLEDLGNDLGDFDAVHCRGVLMHIPRFEAALAELCRLLRPGGRILLMENNDQSVETAVVRAARAVRHNQSVMVRTPGGLEFHCPSPGQAPLARIATVAFLEKQLAAHGVRTVARWATEFWDINRFPAGPLRNLAVAFNWTWFAFHLPAHWSMGNAIIGEKAKAYAGSRAGCNGPNDVPQPVGT